jgi:hypothetical protein
MTAKVLAENTSSQKSCTLQTRHRRLAIIGRWTATVAN